MRSRLILALLAFVATFCHMNISQAGQMGSKEDMIADVLKPLVPYDGRHFEETVTAVAVEGVTYKADISLAMRTLENMIADRSLSYDRKWYLTQGALLYNERHLIHSASSEELQMLLAGIVRDERFNTGSFGQALANGLIGTIANRLRALAL